MRKLGPGSGAVTLHVLRLLPTGKFRVVVDAGCGAGRQTLALARELGTPVLAVDSHEPFLNDLVRRAGEAGLDHLVQTHRRDMKDIPRVCSGIDLLWSEGAAYNIGFANALVTWATALRPGGFAVVSELSWLKEQAPEAARGFFRSGYPGMRPVQGNVAAAEGAGFKMLATHTSPRQARVDDSYDVFGPGGRLWEMGMRIRRPGAIVGSAEESPPPGARARLEEDCYTRLRLRASTCRPPKS